MTIESGSEVAKNSKYFLYIAIIFVAVLMISNTVAVKLISIGPFVISGASFIFPISYIFGDILTEVYGYRASRKIIWCGFITLILMSLCYWIIQMLPAAPSWANQGAYELILGSVPRIVLASVIAYFAGEFANSYILSKMKIRTQGKKLWMRTIGSTIVGQGVDSVFFVVIAFAGTIPVSVLLTIIVSIYLFKVAYEIIITPVTYAVVNWLKRAEGIDVYDRGISYNPFSLKE
jgi:queuosine precursor transporter